MIGLISTLTFLGLAIGTIVGLLAVGFVEAMLWINHQLKVGQTTRDVKRREGDTRHPPSHLPAIFGRRKDPCASN